MTIRDITECLEDAFPLAYQENYDNSGLQLGNLTDHVQSALITIDITEKVIEEAIQLGAGLVISHHPLIFQGIKRLNGTNMVERCILKAIRNNVALYACHTNADNLKHGLNGSLAKRLGLVNTRILVPVKGKLNKLITFVPHKEADRVRMAIFDAGAGHIGEYDMCSYNVEGTGTFRGSPQSKPFAGKKEVYHLEQEVRIETIVPVSMADQVVKALIKAHPYEEPAYDLYPLDNKYIQAGAGMLGELTEDMESESFIRFVKERLGTETIRHSDLLPGKIHKVAICGGSGSFLIRDAIRQGADAFVTADLKYHQFFEAEGRLLLLDAGHYETEQVMKELFYEVLIKKFPNFAVRFSEVNTNPVNYN